LACRLWADRRRGRRKAGSDARKSRHPISTPCSRRNSACVPVSTGNAFRIVPSDFAPCHLRFRIAQESVCSCTHAGNWARRPTAAECRWNQSV
jgi:hypothetical protein